VAAADQDWPDDATRLSYPDWLVQRLQEDLGAQAAIDALEAMNLSSKVTTRPDGYVQDLASQWVAQAVGAGPNERVLDVAAAPGGKATALAATGATVVAADVRETRIGLVSANVRRLGLGNVHPVVADGTSPPFASGIFDRVLVDAPCSGLGVLHRRPDARWRIDPQDITELAALQRRLLDAAADLVGPQGLLVYSVCTLSRAETLHVDQHLLATRPDLEAVPVVGAPWEPAGRGALLLPQRAETDGMFLLALRRLGAAR
jgi:16S rRNA (cytosine967-C5)-methyltransferase